MSEDEFVDEEVKGPEATIDIWKDASRDRKDTPVEVWIEQCERFLEKPVSRTWRSEVEAYLIGIGAYKHPRVPELMARLQSYLDVVMNRAPEGTIDERRDKRDRKLSAERDTLTF